MSTPRVELGDSRDVLKTLPDCSVDSVVTDPPYALVSIVKRFGKDGAAPAKPGKTGAYARASAGFMGAKWDVGDTAFAVEFWREVWRVLKPGGHVVAFGGTRTYHRLACAIEDAGFEIRDMAAWLYGSGFPKSHDVSKAIDKAAGAEREPVRVPASEVRNPKARGAGRDGTEGATRPWIEEALERGYHEKPGDKPATDAARKWEGWGTALKPAHEPICLARKPLDGTVAENVLKFGTGGINIDACRINDAHQLPSNSGAVGQVTGRWPANVVTDGSAEVVAAFPSPHGAGAQAPGRFAPGNANGTSYKHGGTGFRIGDEGSAARFFYSAKADAGDRLESKHPTVKPVDLMRWLVRLVTPPGGLVLDPFAGSGTTGMACMAEGFDCILVEREADYVADIRRRIAHVSGEDTPLFKSGGGK